MYIYVYFKYTVIISLLLSEIITKPVGAVGGRI